MADETLQQRIARQRADREARDGTPDEVAKAKRKAAGEKSVRKVGRLMNRLSKTANELSKNHRKPIHETALDLVLEGVGTIEQDSNREHLGRTSQAGPDPRVQRELKNQGILHRVAKMKSRLDRGKHEDA